MNSYFAKVSDRLINDKRPFSDHNADELKEFINSKKPENIYFKVPLIKSDELKSILKSPYWFGVRFGATGSSLAKELTVSPMADRVYSLGNLWCTVW